MANGFGLVKNLAHQRSRLYKSLLCLLLCATWNFCIVVFSTVFSSSTSATSLTVGINALPTGRGNPYSGIYIPSIITWSAVFESLTHVDNEGQLVPWVAIAWEQFSANSWRFILQPDLTFANGEPLDAKAVVAAINYVTGLGRERGEPVARELDHLASARALSPLEVEIKTHTASPFLPQELTNLRLVAPRAWNELGPDAFGAQPVGSGPFQTEQWTEARLILRRNPNAWRPPHANELVLQTTPNVSTRLQALQSGDIDIATSIPSDAINLIENRGGAVYTVSLPGAISVILNTKKSPLFRDVRVRQALNYAVDKDLIVDQLLAGRTRAVSQPSAHTAFGYDESLQPYPFDLERAKALLAEAGYPDGFEFVLEATGSVGTASAIYQQVAANLALVGVTMEIHTLPITQTLANIQSGNWGGDAFVMSYFTPTFDALRPQRNQSCLWHNPWYCDEAIMPTIEAAFEEFDLTKRLTLTREVMVHAHNHAQGLFLYENVAFDGLGPGISGYRSDFGFIHYDAILKSVSGA